MIYTPRAARAGPRLCMVVPSLAGQTFRGPRGERTSGDCSRLSVCNRGML